jgi:hypothetical protein
VCVFAELKSYHRQGKAKSKPEQAHQVQDRLHARAVDAVGLEVDQHQVVVGAA